MFLTGSNCLVLVRVHNNRVIIRVLILHSTGLILYSQNDVKMFAWLTLCVCVSMRMCMQLYILVCAHVFKHNGTCIHADMYIKFTFINFFCKFMLIIVLKINLSGIISKNPHTFSICNICIFHFS